MKLRRIILGAVLTSMALCLFIIESFIQLPFAFPGAKIGLANIVSVIALYLLSPIETFIIIILRVFLGTILTGNLSSFLFSLSGAMLSFLMMLIAMKILKDKATAVGISMIGGISHNIGQVLIAMLILQNINIFWYLPFLLITGLVTGIFIGLTAKYLIEHMKKINVNYMIKG